MIDLLPPPMAMKVVEARGYYGAEPLDQLISAVHDGWVGETLALRMSDRTCLRYVLEWVERSGHGLVGVYQQHGYDEVIVEVRH
jgi:hypothetical protein